MKKVNDRLPQCPQTTIEWRHYVVDNYITPANINNVDINQLEVLVTVARERSFSRAAKVLGRTQPAISQAIQRLESEVGETLIDRSSKDGTLTIAGTTLVEYGSQMLNLRNHARSSLIELRNLTHGKVTISANEHTVFFLLPVIEEFRKKHSLIKIEVKRGVASRIPKQITDREVELGLISFTPNDETLCSVPVILDDLTLVVAPEHRLAGERSVGIVRLGAEIFVAHNAQSPYRQKVIETFAANKTKLNIAVELPSLEAIKKLVERNVGVALVPRLTAKSEIESGRLIAISVAELRLQRRLNFVYRRNSELSHAAKAFLEMSKNLSV